MEEINIWFIGDPWWMRSAIVTTYIEATNGVVHAIDTVLVPFWFWIKRRMDINTLNFWIYKN